MKQHEDVQSGGVKVRKGEQGTSLFELMIALAVFLIISGAAFNLFNLQQVSSSKQQGLTGLSLSLRNAASQMEMDLSNAGNGFYQQGISIPAWPVGITIGNNWVSPTGTACNSGTTYGVNCFDSLNIISSDPTLYPAVMVTNASAGTNPASSCSSTTNTSVYVLPVSITGPPAVSLTTTQTAGLFNPGDEIILIKGNGSYMTATTVTSSSAGGSVVTLGINTTNADGSSYIGHDPLNIVSCGNTVAGQPCPVSAPPTGYTAGITLGTSFCYGDWIIKLTAVQYQVNSSNPADPILTRSVFNSGTSSTVMEQIIGFKVGAALYDMNANTPGDFNPAFYNYNAAAYCDGAYGSSYAACTGAGGYWTPNSFWLVRSVRVSVIGRTVPNYSSQYVFRNTFDNGPYQVQGTAFVVNPRNLSMMDDTTLP